MIGSSVLATLKVDTEATRGASKAPSFSNTSFTSPPSSATLSVPGDSAISDLSIDPQQDAFIVQMEKYNAVLSISNRLKNEELNLLKTNEHITTLKDLISLATDQNEKAKYEGMLKQKLLDKLHM